MAGKLGMSLIVTGIVLVIAFFFLQLPMTLTIATITTVLGLIVLLHGPGIVKFVNLKGQPAYLLGIVLLVFAFASGAFAAINLTPAALTGGVPTAALGGSALTAGSVGTISGSADAASCLDYVRSINSNLAGNSATVTVNAYDREADSPESSTVGTNAWVYVNGAYRGTVTTNGGTITNVKAGEVVDVYGGNATYYVDPVVGHCVSGAQETIELDAHAVATTANMAITAYDNTNAAALTSGTTNQEDYKLAIGSAGNDNFYTRLRVDAANVAFRFGGWLVLASEGNQSSIDYFRLSDESGYYTDKVPTWAKGSVALNSTATQTTSNVSGYDWAYVKKDPVLLKSYQEIRPNWVFKAAAGVDPVEFGGNTQEAYNTVILLSAVDADWSRNSGTNTLSIHDETVAEAQVGLDEVHETLFPMGVSSAVDTAVLITVT